MDDLKKMLQSYLQLFHSSPLAAVLPSLAGERAHNPELSALFDPVTRERRQPLIRALERRARAGRAVVLATHDDEVRRMCSPVVELST